MENKIYKLTDKEFIDLVKTKILKTCRNTLLRNINKLWNGYYFKIIESK